MDWFALSEKAFSGAVIFYLIGTLLYLVYLAKKTKQVGWAATGVTILAVALHTAGLLFRWFEGGINHPPFTNLYESLLFFSWAIALFYLILEFKYDFRSGGAFILPVALGAIGAAALSPESSKEVGTLLPALQSHWLHAHVAVAAMAYAAFVGSFGASFMFLIKDGVHKGMFGFWANIFMAFMLLISDRLNILTHRVFTMKAVADMPDIPATLIPLTGAGKLFLVATVYFLIAAVLYRLSVPGDSGPLGKLKSLFGKDSDPAHKFAPFATFVTGLGGVTTLIGLIVVFRSTGLAPNQLAALVKEAGMVNADAYAMRIVQAGMAMSLKASPFKIIILALIIFMAFAAVALDLGMEWVRKILPDADRLDALSYTVITVAFPLMTMVIVTGAVWAKYAFGHYWQWDPKETASLITWLIYTAYLHARVSLNWSERSVAIISIIGFASVVFTYLGVNVIGPGYHAYASI